MLRQSLEEKEGALSSSDANTSGTGRKRENQTPDGSAMRAVVIPDTPWQSCLQRRELQVLADEG